MLKLLRILPRRNCITNKCDAVNVLRKICDTESNIECELIAYALVTILCMTRSMKNKLKIRLKNVLFLLTCLSDLDL